MLESKNFTKQTQRWFNDVFLPGLPENVASRLKVQERSYCTYSSLWTQHRCLVKKLEDESNFQAVLQEELQTVPGIGQSWAYDIHLAILESLDEGTAPHELVLGDAEQLYRKLKDMCPRGMRPVNRKGVRALRQWWTVAQG